MALLEDEAARERMRRDLSEVALKLSGGHLGSEHDPLEAAAAQVERYLAEKHLAKEEMVHVS
jgi:hypothetical protein